jgi:hypothetical protein
MGNGRGGGRREVNGIVHSKSGTSHQVPNRRWVNRHPRGIPPERSMAHPMLRISRTQKAPMNAASTFTLGFAPLSESTIETLDRLLNREALQRIATLASLISEAIGFFVIGILIIVNRHQADLDGVSGGSLVAVVGGTSAILVGTTFLVAACLYGRFCARSSAPSPASRRTARVTFSIPQSITAIAVLS